MLITLKAAPLQIRHRNPRCRVEIILAILGVLSVLGTIAVQRAHAQTFTLLHTFAGPVPGGTGADRVASRTPLLLGSSGNLYGTTTTASP